MKPTLFSKARRTCYGIKLSALYKDVISCQTRFLSAWDGSSAAYSLVATFGQLADARA